METIDHQDLVYPQEEMNRQEKMMLRDEHRMYRQMEQKWHKTNMLDTSRLCPHSIVKNYKVMCELLGEQVTTGNAKKAQLKEWERYFSFERQGQKFLIGEIYDIPYPKLALANHSKYAKYIEFLIAAKLDGEGNGRKVVTKTELYKWLYLINDQYIHEYQEYQRRQRERMEKAERRRDAIRQGKPVAEEDKPIDWFSAEVLEAEKTEKRTELFFKATRRQFDDLIRRALLRLEDKLMIVYGLEVVICKIKWIDEKDGMEVIDFCESEEDEGSDGSDTGKKRVLVYEIADEDEIHKLVTACRDVLESMGYGEIGLSILFFHGRINEYYMRVSKYLQKQYGWAYAYTRYWIRYDPQRISGAAGRLYNKLRKEEQREEILKAGAQLNHAVCQKLSEAKLFKRIAAATGSPFADEDEQFLMTKLDELVRIDQLDAYMLNERVTPRRDEGGLGNGETRQSRIIAPQKGIDDDMWDLGFCGGD